jgi:hypothetical protein
MSQKETRGVRASPVGARKGPDLAALLASAETILRMPIGGYERREVRLRFTLLGSPRFQLRSYDQVGHSYKYRSPPRAENVLF